MKFAILLAGILLIVIGLFAYATIPNLHQVATYTRQKVTGPVDIPVGPGSESETPENVTLAAGRVNELVVDLTVSLQTGGLSSIQFKVFAAPQLGSCMQQTNPDGCLVDTTVSNQTVRVQLNPSTTNSNSPTVYYFGFANKDPTSKTISVSASLSASRVDTVAGRDGSLNFAALGLSVLGLLVAVYGVAARTIIPWE